MRPEDKVIPLTRIIHETKRKIDSLEWEGDFTCADSEINFLAHLEQLQANGDTWYPLF